MFWDPEGLKHGEHAVRYHRDMPLRLGVIPRRGGPDRWRSGMVTGQVREEQLTDTIRRRLHRHADG